MPRKLPSQCKRTIQTGAIMISLGSRVKSATLKFIPYIITSHVVFISASTRKTTKTCEIISRGHETGRRKKKTPSIQPVTIVDKVKPGKKAIPFKIAPRTSLIPQPIADQSGPNHFPVKKIAKKTKLI